MADVLAMRLMDPTRGRTTGGRGGRSWTPGEVVMDNGAQSYNAKSCGQAGGELSPSERIAEVRIWVEEQVKEADQSMAFSSPLLL